MKLSSQSQKKCQFASDNYAGICPEAWDGMTQANDGYARSYGDDEWTRQASDKIRAIFDNECEVFFVFNGTAANSLALSALCRSYHSVICHESAHIETDECGGPEFFSNGTKILTTSGYNGKIDPDAVEKIIQHRSDIHYPKPKVLSITQSTELGTVYGIDELKVLQRIADKYDLKFHMDGARFANAIASMNVHPSEITWKIGLDVLCFGGAKNGLAIGEALIFFNQDLAFEFDYRCKQAGQLASKMRFLASPWIKILDTGAWLKHAGHANRMAGLLAEKLEQIDNIEIIFPCQVNAVFVKMDESIAEALFSQGWYFYNFIGKGMYRLMCSWNTSENDIDDFIQAINKAQ